MKKDMILGIGVGFVIGIILMLIISTVTKGKEADDTVSISLPEISKLTDDYLAKVEKFGIALSDFTNAYDQVKKNLPPEQLAQLEANEPAFKAEILETMINQYVVVATAIEEGFLEDKENTRLFRNAAQQALFQLYIAKNMPENTNAFMPSKPEIDQAYAQFGNELRARGLNAQQSKEVLIGQIAKQKQQRWMIDFITKIKEGYRIERNDKLLEKEKISSSVLPQSMTTP